MKRILSIFLSLVLTAALLSPAAAAANETDGKDSDWLYITLDPGHGGNGAGGNDPGAISSTYGYHEADLVLKIGLYLKQELETYRNVHVDMTRSDSYGTSATAPLSKVENRVLFAAGQHSDLLVSLHLNSSPSQSARGAEVLVSNGNYRPEIAKVLDGVAGNILAQLKNLGIYNRGLVKKSSQDNTLYPNGKLADYYGIVRYGVENNVPSMIVEHCIISSNSECEQFLSSDAKLRAIAQADARGIAAYYGLQKKDPGEVDVEPTFYDCRHHWARTSIEAAADAGWVNGVGAGEFQPNGTLTRAEAAKLLYELMTAQAHKQYDRSDNGFSDVPAGKWYVVAVSTLANAGAIKGYSNGTFQPGKPITRAEFVTILTGIYGANTSKGMPFAEVGSAWWHDAVATAYANGWVGGYADGTFHPNQTITRAEAVTILNRVLGRSCDLTFVQANAQAASHFTDVTPGAWYYAAVTEASVGHTFTELTGIERWTALA